MCCETASCTEDFNRPTMSRSLDERDLFNLTPSAATMFGIDPASGYRSGVGSTHRDHPGPLIEGPTMSDKSPRQTMTKKTGKSLKEKRAAKHAKADGASQAESVLNPKKR